MKLPDPGILHLGPQNWDLGPSSYRNLEALATRFLAAEVSRSAWHPLRPEVSRLWARIASSRGELRFSVRAWQDLLGQSEPQKKDYALFREGIRPLEQSGLLSAVLLEFPCSFRFSREARDKVIGIRRALAGIPLVAEFPHISWMSEGALGFLIDFHIGIVNLDQFQHARAMPPTAFLTSPVGYVRLHGRNAPEAGFSKDYLYCEQELEGWSQRIHKINRFAERTFVTFREKSLPRAVWMSEKLVGNRQLSAIPDQSELFSAAA